jgi:kynureninase
MTMSASDSAALAGRLPQSLAEAEALDQIEPLQRVRSAFDLPPDLIYLDGHSLGPPPAAARARLGEAMTAWERGLIRSWNDAGWIDLPTRVGDRIARLLGAREGEVLVCDSVSVNLFKLAAAALPLARTRVIHVEEGEFPTDAYIAAGLAEITGAGYEQVAPEAGLDALSRGGVLIKSVVNYRTAAIADIAQHEAAAAAGGSAIVWDLSHAAGVLALDLTAAGVRLATGCTYKYLNGGPGAPAYLFVRSDIADRLSSPIRGWFGHAAPFAFDRAYAPAPGVARFAAGTPGILSLATLEGALDVFDGVDMQQVEHKARRLGDLWLACTAHLGWPTASPTGGNQRGGHVTQHHRDGYAIIQALIAAGVIGDFRAPDGMRFGFAPLHLRYADIWRAAGRLSVIIDSGAYRDPRYSKPARVT